MKRFLVTMPFTGTVTLEVEAETEEEAIEGFYRQWEEERKDAVKRGVAFGLDTEAQEWSFVERICRGNVFSCVRNEVEAEDVGDA